MGNAVAQLTKALCYQPEGRGLSSRWCHWIFFIVLLPLAKRPWGRLGLWHRWVSGPSPGG